MGLDVWFYRTDKTAYDNKEKIEEKLKDDKELLQAFHALIDDYYPEVGYLRNPWELIVQLEVEDTVDKIISKEDIQGVIEYYEARKPEGHEYVISKLQEILDSFNFRDNYLIIHAWW